MERNRDIRQILHESRVRQWEIAEKIGCDESVISRKLRKELSPAEKTKFLMIIDEIQRERGE